MKGDLQNGDWTSDTVQFRQTSRKEKTDLEVVRGKTLRFSLGVTGMDMFKTEYL